MDAIKEAQIKAYALALAELLYKAMDLEQVKILEGIKVAVRDYLLEDVRPKLEIFLSAQAAARPVDESGKSKASPDRKQVYFEKLALLRGHSQGRPANACRS